VEKVGLSVRLLGEIRLSRRGSAVALPASRKTRALLGYLIAAATPQPRQRLCDLLWDGPDDPRAALRWSLTKLRPLVDDPGANRLVADRERVGFEARGATVDLFEAQALLDRGVVEASTEALTRAAGELGGDFLEGLELPDCYRFHEWCTAERERFRGLRLGVLDALVERLEGPSPEEALRYARQRLAIDPLSDAAHARAVKLLARLGRTAEALAQFETCRRILERELGGRRSPLLELARMEIGKTEARASPSPRAETESMTARPARSPPASREVPAARTPRRLVARAAERATLEALVRRTAEGGGGDVVLLSGEPGIGKSRLLAELEGLAKASGGTLLAGRAYEAESVRPFGLWVDMLRGAPLEHIDSELRGHLAPLFPELGAGPSPTPAESKARLFDGVARLLCDRATRAPVILAIDDLHWLDEASASLLYYVARVTAGARVGIACATRDGELEDNPGALRFVRGLRRDGRLSTVAVAPLDEVGTTALVHEAGGDGIDAARVFQESGGNPLFALELARALAGGAHDGPQPLDALFEERLARLTARAREVVVWAAALGREFQPEVLALVMGESLAHTAAALGELEHEGIAVGSGEGHAFTHELLRRAAYRQLTSGRQRLVHLAIARALAAAPDPGASWGDVVHHASLANDSALAARACAAAGARALRMLARLQARAFAVRGLSYAAHLGAAGLPIRVELLEVAALSAAMDTARNVTLEQDAEEAVRLAREIGRPELAAKALFALGFFRSAHGDFEGTHGVTLDAAEASRSAPPEESVPTLANTAFCLAIIERELPKARALLDEAAEMAKIHHLSIIDVEVGDGYLAHLDGQVVHAKGALERGLALARSRADSWRQSMALIRLAMIDLEACEWETTRARAGELREVASKLGEGSEGAIAEALDALAARGAREPGAAERLALAIEAVVRADAKAILAYVLTTAAEMAADDLAFEAARELAGRALAAAAPLGKPSAIVLAHAALGRAALGLGDRESALAELEATRALIDHPYGVSRRAREAALRLGELSNGRTNAATHGEGAKMRRKR
jgi:DNA-binding SARP family transcriptional activator